MCRLRKRGVVLPELMIFIILVFLLASGFFIRASIKGNRHVLLHETESFAIWLTDNMDDARMRGEVFILDIVNVRGRNHMAVINYVYGPRTGKQETWFSDSIDMGPDQVAKNATFDGRQEGWGTALSFTFRSRFGNPMTKRLTVSPLGYMHLEENFNAKK